MHRSFAIATVSLTFGAGVVGCGGSSHGAAPVATVAPISPVAEQYAMTPDGVRLYYRVVGTGGETVLAPFALFYGSALDPLAHGRRIVTYDPRGRGRSDSVPLEKVSLDLLQLDLETVRRAVGADRVALIGWSGGGMEMFVYALRNPHRVTRLVQLAPIAPRFDPYGPLMMKDRAMRTDSAAKERLDRRIAAGDFRTDPAGLCRAQAAVQGPPLFADPAHAPATPDVCRYPNEYPGRLGPYFGALFKSLDGFDWRDSLSAVTIPRLVIHGARDNTPLAGNWEWVAGQANARLLVVEGAGHWPHYEQRDVTLRAIDAFLSGGWPQDAVAVPANEPDSAPSGASQPARN
jgi:pimeloyl-ACP methyl ester carboxylesterase